MAEAEHDCPDCAGAGWLTVDACCGVPTVWGECCGQAVPEQQGCLTCVGSGRVQAALYPDPDAKGA